MAVRYDETIPSFVSADGEYILLGFLKWRAMMPIKEDDVEAVAEAIELVESHSSEAYARAAIAALVERGWQPSTDTGSVT